MHVLSPQGVYKNPSVTRILFKMLLTQMGSILTMAGLALLNPPPHRLGF